VTCTTVLAEVAALPGVEVPAREALLQGAARLKVRAGSSPDGVCVCVCVLEAHLKVCA
jgi:hypothetical protein